MLKLTIEVVVNVVVIIKLSHSIDPFSIDWLLLSCLISKRYLLYVVTNWLVAIGILKDPID